MVEKIKKEFMEGELWTFFTTGILVGALLGLFIGILGGLYE